jgi:hypothetical protein
MESEKYPYQNEWEEYKRRQKTFWLVFLGFIPFILLINGVSNELFGKFPSGYEIGLVGFVIAWSICSIRFQYWKCPNCGKSFHRKWWWTNIFSSKCLHCKLPKYEGSTFYNNRLWNANR